MMMPIGTSGRVHGERVKTVSFGGPEVKGHDHTRTKTYLEA